MKLRSWMPTYLTKTSRKVIWLCMENWFLNQMSIFRHLLAPWGEHGKQILSNVKLLILGFFCFLFESLEDKKRVVENGPWLFSSNLLVLLEGDPNTSEHCYDFSHNAFWVHILGLPRARINEDSVRNIASKLGKVEKVQLEARNSNSFLLLMWSNWALCQLLPWNTLWRDGIGSRQTREVWLLAESKS